MPPNRSNNPHPSPTGIGSPVGSPPGSVPPAVVCVLDGELCFVMVFEVVSSLEDMDAIPLVMAIPDVSLLLRELPPAMMETPAPPAPPVDD